MMKFPAKRIVIIATRQIGDVLLVTPLLRSVRHAYPEAQIDMVVFTGKHSILLGNPDCDQILCIPERASWRETRTLIRQLLRRYDLALSTLTGDRPCLYALLAAPRRVLPLHSTHWNQAWKRGIAHAWTEFDDVNTHTVIQNLQLADLLEIPRCYEVVVPYAATAAQQLDDNLSFAWKTTPYAVLHLTPMWRYKRWTEQGWAELVSYFADQGWQIVLTGGPAQAELDYLASVTADFAVPVVNMAGRLNFAEVAELLSHAQIYVGPDTAVTHLAAATGVSTVALFGPTNPVKWAPWGKYHALQREERSPYQRLGTQQVANVLLVQGEAECVPCHQEGCERHRDSYSECLDTLSSIQVIAGIERLLQRQQIMS